MEYFLELFFGGLTRGSIYALIALGYTMVYGIIQLINFAHGEVLMVGALTAWSIDTTGYNFEDPSTGTNRPNGNKWIRHQFTFTPVTGLPYKSITINKVLAVND